MTTDKTWPCP